MEDLGKISNIVKSRELHVISIFSILPEIFFLFL